MPGSKDLGDASDYLLDACQRSILFLDVLRRRGNTFRERQESSAPHVLTFETELIADGRTFERPTNYLLVKISPKDGAPTVSSKRPFVVVDPRAGHGPGIGGMKQDSEIGVALDNGHPCYFVGFLPDPVPGQTIEDVWNSEAMFLEEVARRHPEGGKPAVIANCQAGWQTAIMAATHPDVPGPLMLAGAPLSYWAGVHGKNPLRYLGGMLGGTWLTRAVGDLGQGKFDGANLVANFESMNPANTYFDKPYDVYSKVDTEAQRFLDFETWWGSPVLMNADEMQWIADNLFVGNKLTSGTLSTSGGVRIDLRNIKSPIIVFCSWADDITPPQQALGWITDLYPTDRDLVASGQTIVYMIHETVGHLGIFVSGKVAAREHQEFTSVIEMIDLMPPGLYEAVIQEVDESTANRSLIHGERLFRLEPRKLEDIRKLGGNSAEDNLKFAAVDRVSRINARLYDTYARPFINAVTPPGFGEWAAKMHPNRVRFAIFSDENPAMRFVAESAEQIRSKRRGPTPDNAFSAAEKAAAKAISGTLSAVGTARDKMTEQLFHSIYGSRFLQALVGLSPDDAVGDGAIRDAAQEEALARKLAELETKFDAGGSLEAAVRSIAYVFKAEASADERSFVLLKALKESQPKAKAKTQAELKTILRDQSLLLRLDEERAVAAIPKLVARKRADANAALEIVRRVVAAPGEPSPEGRKRLARIEKLFRAKPSRPARKGASK